MPLENKALFSTNVVPVYGEEITMKKAKHSNPKMDLIHTQNLAFLYSRYSATVLYRSLLISVVLTINILISAEICLPKTHETGQRKRCYVHAT